MQIFSAPKLLKNFLFESRCSYRTIGLVPTMGALHQGHLSLIKNSLNHSDLTVCSIYVNPTQFNNQKDLLNYPRDLDQDLKKLQGAGCDAVFCPEDTTMYPSDPIISVDFGILERVMEGQQRPGHFNGVALVVAKLFHVVHPDHAYFGQKDWQQLTIIKQMVKDLNFDVEIMEVPIEREPDGLAMSSRNARLTPIHRQLAPELHQALIIVKDQLENSRSLSRAKAAGMSHLRRFPEIKLEYLEIVQPQSLQEPVLSVGEEPLSICLAAGLGEVRLIDNISVFS